MRTVDLQDESDEENVEEDTDRDSTLLNRNEDGKVDEGADQVHDNKEAKRLERAARAARFHAAIHGSERALMLGMLAEQQGQGQGQRLHSSSSVRGADGAAGVTPQMRSIMGIPSRGAVSAVAAVAAVARRSGARRSRTCKSASEGMGSRGVPPPTPGAAHVHRAHNHDTVHYVPFGHLAFGTAIRAGAVGGQLADDSRQHRGRIATHKGSGRHFLLHAVQWTWTKQQEKDLLKEANMARKLHHPALCHIFSVAVRDPWGSASREEAFLSEPLLVWGDSLLALLFDVALGMRYLHARQLAHGALQPTTIHITSRWHAKLSEYALRGGGVESRLDESAHPRHVLLGLEDPRDVFFEAPERVALLGLSVRRSGIAATPIVQCASTRSSSRSSSSRSSSSRSSNGKQLAPSAHQCRASIGPLPNDGEEVAPVATQVCEDQHTVRNDAESADTWAFGALICHLANFQKQSRRCDSDIESRGGEGDGVCGGGGVCGGVGDGGGGGGGGVGLTAASKCEAGDVQEASASGRRRLSRVFSRRSKETDATTTFADRPPSAFALLVRLVQGKASPLDGIDGSCCPSALIELTKVRQWTFHFSDSPFTTPATSVRAISPNVLSP